MGEIRGVYGVRASAGPLHLAERAWEGATTPVMSTRDDSFKRVRLHLGLQWRN